MIVRLVLAVIVVPVIAAGVVPPIAPGDGKDDVDPPNDTEVPAIVIAEFVRSEFGTVPTVTADTLLDAAPTRNTPALDGRAGRL